MLYRKVSRILRTYLDRFARYHALVQIAFGVLGLKDLKGVL